MIALEAEERLQRELVALERSFDATLAALGLDPDGTYDFVSSKALPGLSKVPGKQNWIEHLPAPLRAAWKKSWIYRAAKHLHWTKGMPVGRGIAVAINAARKGAATGDLNFPGLQSVNVKSRAEMATSLATWASMKAANKAKSAANFSGSMNVDLADAYMLLTVLDPAGAVHDFATATASASARDGESNSQRARNWDEEQYNREPEGSPVGGRFAKKNGSRAKGARNLPVSKASKGSGRAAFTDKDGDGKDDRQLGKQGVAKALAGLSPEMRKKLAIYPAVLGAIAQAMKNGENPRRHLLRLPPDLRSPARDAARSVAGPARRENVEGGTAPSTAPKKTAELSTTEIVKLRKAGWAGNGKRGNDKLYPPDHPENAEKNGGSSGKYKPGMSAQEIAALPDEERFKIPMSKLPPPPKGSKWAEDRTYVGGDFSGDGYADGYYTLEFASVRDSGRGISGVQSTQSKYDKPATREKLKEQIKAGSKGGPPEKWTARKAQLLSAAYQKAGGGYRGPKDSSQESLSKWSGEDWQTAPGQPDKAGSTHRYLPKKAWEDMSPAEREATERKKRSSSAPNVPNTTKAKRARTRNLSVHRASSGEATGETEVTRDFHGGPTDRRKISHTPQHSHGSWAKSNPFKPMRNTRPKSGGPTSKALKPAATNRSGSVTPKKSTAKPAGGLAGRINREPSPAQKPGVPKPQRKSYTYRPSAVGNDDLDFLGKGKSTTNETRGEEPDDENTLEGRQNAEERKRREAEERASRQEEDMRRKLLGAAIQDQGGLAPSKTLSGEYREIPSVYKRKDGLPGDVMADTLRRENPELGIKTERDLIDALTGARRNRAHRAAAPLKRSKASVRPSEKAADKGEPGLKAADKRRVSEGNPNGTMADRIPLKAGMEVQSRSGTRGNDGPVEGVLKDGRIAWRDQSGELQYSPRSELLLIPPGQSRTRNLSAGSIAADLSEAYPALAEEATALVGTITRDLAAGVSVQIPSQVQAAARRGLEMRKQYGRGGTSVGLATARLLAAGGSISPGKALHVARYFARHAGDNLTRKAGEAPSNGLIAWLLWGGNAGRTWAEGFRNRTQQTVRKGLRKSPVHHFQGDKDRHGYSHSAKVGSTDADMSATDTLDLSGLVLGALELSETHEGWDADKTYDFHGGLRDHRQIKHPAQGNHGAWSPNNPFLPARNTRGIWQTWPSRGGKGRTPGTKPKPPFKKAPGVTPKKPEPIGTQATGQPVAKPGGDTPGKTPDPPRTRGTIKVGPVIPVGPQPGGDGPQKPAAPEPQGMTAARKADELLKRLGVIENPRLRDEAKKALDTVKRPDSNYRDLILSEQGLIKARGAAKTEPEKDLVKQIRDLVDSEAQRKNNGGAGAQPATPEPQGGESGPDPKAKADELEKRMKGLIQGNAKKAIQGALDVIRDPQSTPEDYRQSALDILRNRPRRIKSREQGDFLREVSGLLADAGRQATERPKGDPGPAIKPVGDAIDHSGAGKFGKITKPTQDLIDKIHTDGRLPKLKVKPSKAKTYYGQYSHNGPRYEISISDFPQGTEDDHPELTYVHEVGHFLDNTVLRNPDGRDRYGSQQKDTANPKMRALVKALDNSEAIQDFKDMADGKKNAWGEPVEPGKFVYLDRDTLDYHLRPREQLARAYAQYIADKSGDKKLRDQLDRQRRPGTYMNNRQWTDEDFAPIRSAFDDLFREEGWLK